MSIAAIGQICLNLGICSILLAHLFAWNASQSKRIADAAKTERRYQTCVRESVLKANLEQSKIWIERHTAEPFAISSVGDTGGADSLCDHTGIGYRLLATDQNETFPDWPNRSVFHAAR